MSSKVEDEIRADAEAVKKISAFAAETGIAVDELKTSHETVLSLANEAPPNVTSVLLKAAELIGQTAGIVEEERIKAVQH